MLKFMHDYDSEEQREMALLAWRYPDGFICTECGNTTYCRPRNKPGVLQCNRCRYQTRLLTEQAVCLRYTADGK